ncbi:MAG: MbcA/ParS/Xre antitoxin family protein [Boseongicola sp.]|nr:MbcA/ParS/Xre antitoxin family protein [Boseongicola sp.]
MKAFDETEKVHILQFAESGQFEPRRIAAALRTSSEEVAQTVGLSKDALQRRTRINSAKTQRRLRELVEVLNKVEPRFGSELMAYAWFRSEPLAGFDGRTAMQLVQEGKARQVLEYIDAMDAGVFA